MEKEKQELENLVRNLGTKIDTLYIAIQGNKGMGHIGIIDKMGDILEMVKEHDEELRKIKEDKKKNRWIVAGIATGAGLGSEKLIELLKRFLDTIT